MGFRSIIVNQHSKLSYKHNHLLFRSERGTESLHLSEIDLLVLETTDITITSMLLAKLVQENICMILCDEKRLPTAQLVPFYGRHDTSLTLKKQIAWKETVKDDVALALLKQKIKNQAWFLSGHGFAEKANAVAKLGEEIHLKDPDNREGHAARIFFCTLYGNDFSRQDTNDINAALDYGYTLVMSVFAREIVKCGCVTQLGINHVNQFNPFNLASDMMEPFRVLVDDIVYRHRKQPFGFVKRELLDMFSATYRYNNAAMYLTNIVAHYVKSCVAYLNEDADALPAFILGHEG